MIPDIFYPILSLFTLSLPLLSFIVLSLGERKLARFTSPVAISLTAISFSLALYLFYQVIIHSTSFILPLNWFEVGSFTFKIPIHLDFVSTLMLVIVTGVSLLVQLFSIEYMKDDEKFTRYFAYLGLFTFSMLGLLLSSNLIIIYIFWELVGLSSYLLIGFWREKQSAIRAAKKAFLLNRIGDSGFLIGIGVLFSIFQTTDLLMIEQAFLQGEVLTANYILFVIAGIGLLMGAVGKSAQFPLSAWLPDAMEGPTPVSALIHAATMVAAGAYLLFRMAFLLTPEVQIVVTVLGTLSAFLAAFAAITQTDIKKVLAYSTISQLGYMVMGVGVGAKEAAFFHLTTHAFFKACLFLSAGVIIHQLHHIAHKAHTHFDAQDLRLMGGLKQKMPVTFWAFLFAGAALAGVPLFSGFLSKDAILVGTWQFASTQSNPIFYLVPILGFMSALMTAFYVSRLFLLIFLGKNRLPKGISLDLMEKPNLKMRLPIVILSALSLGVFFSLNPFNADASWFLEKLSSTVEIDSSIKLWVEILSVLLALTGIVIAFVLFKKGKLLSENTEGKSLLFRLSFHFWYINYFFENPLKRTLIWISNLMKDFDKKVLDKTIDQFAIFHVLLGQFFKVIDRFGIDGMVGGVVWVTGQLGHFTRNIQSAQIQYFFIWALLGVGGIIFWMIL